MTHPNPQPSPTAVAEVLRNAAFYLRHYGWCRLDHYHPPIGAITPSACVTGAIRIAVTGRPIRAVLLHEDPSQAALIRAAVTALAHHLGTPVGVDYETVTEAVDEWNDLIAYDDTEVITTLHETADTLHPAGHVTVGGRR